MFLKHNFTVLTKIMNLCY